MIKFFRKIRKKLVTENRFSKYLVYAIGEIFLVVIGILIALQINTWNQNNQIKQKEFKSLSELQTNLLTNIAEIESFEEDQKDIINRISKILEYTSGDIKYHDSLETYFVGISWLEQINLVSSTYETLKSNGLDIISSDSIRLNIINLHEVIYAQSKDLIKNVGQGLFIAESTPINNKYYKGENRYQSEEYLNYIKDRIRWKTDAIKNLNRAKEETRILINQLEKELQVLKE